MQNHGMMPLMKTLRDLITCSVVLTIISACALAFPTLGRNDRNTELETLLEELRSELHLNENSNTYHENQLTFPNSQMEKRGQINQSPFESFGQYPSASNLNQQQQPLQSQFVDNSAGFSEVKRGSFDFDYGLGGGRFGKRADKLPERSRRPADYFALGGIGGRFGRDTDHATELQEELYDDVEY